MRIGRKRDPDSALSIALKELRKVKRAKKIESTLFSVLVLSVTALSLILLSALFYTGYASYLAAEAGTITEVVAVAQFPTDYWHGLHGLAIRVPGYLGQIYTDVSAGEISSVGIFFDCIQNDPPGGKREVYASTASSINFANLRPATNAEIDAFLGCSGKVDCSNKTFTDIGWVMLGGNNITDVPVTYTFKWDGEPYIFESGILHDETNIVLFTHLTDSISLGYSPNKTVNFQMLLPIPVNTTQRYYFFNDPYDECPAGGGIGEVLETNVYGFISDPLGDPVNGATVIFTGVVNSSDSSGFYNVSSNVTEGTYHVIVTAPGFDMYIFNVTFNATNTSVYYNVTLDYATPGVSDAIYPTVRGYVFDESGQPIVNATVLFGNGNYTTNSSGYYEITSVVNAGNNLIVSYKLSYFNYYYVLYLNESIVYEHNITMYDIPVEKPYDTGPYTEESQKSRRAKIIEEILTTGEDHWINAKEIYKEIRQNTFLKESLAIFNFRDIPMSVTFDISSDLDGVVELESSTLVIPPKTLGEVGLTFYGVKDIGDYNGTITIDGDLKYVIPTFVKIVERRQTIETLLIDLNLMRNVVAPGDTLKYKVSLHNLLSGHSYEVYMKKYLTTTDESFVQYLGDERVEVQNSLSFLESVVIPENATDGDYQIKIDASYLNYFNTVVAPFEVRTPIYMYSFFGIPVWLMLAILAFFCFLFLIYFIYKREMDKRKRYRNALDFSSLPRKEDRSLWLGRIAETKIPAYLQLNNLSTHCIVAGATGGGKSITAQVIVEEVLKQNVAVVVFDPTAQWSGMLRKNEDKRMMSFYPRFKMKPTDAKAFPGSIRMVTDAREIIDVNKHMAPGQIQIFTLNKLDPKDMDIFVANVIRQIFRSDPKESPDVKLLLVFDEVHRLLSKFGGSGEGFLQIERACREFRKWGLGVMLVSQVLSDFVGEIKANINTEVQMRTIEENDLDRIKTKYGPEFLKSLVKSEVGVGMFQNAEYNNGKPYFVNFRPILHNTRRLSDEELKQYNDYNVQSDEIGFQIEELEKKKIDVFDLKMELKLVKDKIMTGNFSVVDIYLQGLKPRLEKQWQKLGMKPPKMKKKLANLEDIKKSVAEAKKSREVHLQEEKKQISEAKKAVVTKMASEKVVPVPGKVVKKIVKKVVPKS